MNVMTPVGVANGFSPKLSPKMKPSENSHAPQNIKTKSLPPEITGKLMRFATYASVFVASTLVIIKFGAWLFSDSVAVLSSLIDSALDVVASLVTLFAVHHALAPADREHRFGHGKAESIAALGQAAFITGSAIFLLLESGNRLIRPQPVNYGDLAITVMAISVVLTFALVRLQLYVVHRTGSLAIGADSIHYKADLLVNAGIIASLVLSTRFGIPVADPLIAVAVAGYILYSAWHIGREALDSLMDHELSEQDRNRIGAIVAAHSAVKGLHDLRTRMAGTKPFIQLHLELPGDMTLHDAHIISDQVEADLLTEFPDAEVIIHQDPEGINEKIDIFED